MRHAAISLSIAIVIAVGLSGCGDNHAKTTASDSRTSSVGEGHPAADNTAQNERDKGATTTPLDQGMSKADTATTQAIRQAVVADKTLSVNAQNVKIITKDGTVTLRGPVKSAQERDAIVAAAQKAAGVDRVINQIDIIAN